MGVWIMAGVTFREAARKKMLWMALAAGGAFLILFGTGLVGIVWAGRAMRPRRAATPR